MALPSIDASDDRIGFLWRTPDGLPTRLDELIAAPEAEPERWLPTHLAALDDVLIDVAGRFGEVLGGGRRPSAQEHGAATGAYREIDRLCHEYARARRFARTRRDPRAGQIIGTGCLLSIRLRAALGLIGPAPLADALDEPALGPVGGHARFRWASATQRWLGGRWVVEAIDGRRLPASLSMLLFDSSGVEKDGARDEHRAALAEVTSAVADSGAEPMAASGALDWLLFDWVMAHRESPESGAVLIAASHPADADMIIAAAEASADVRSQFDPGLLELPE